MRSIATVMLILAVACTGNTAAPAAKAVSSPGPVEPAAKAGVKSNDPSQSGVAFVLLNAATLPEAAAIVRAHAELAPDGPALEIDTRPEDRDQPRMFRQAGAVVSVALLPMAVPDGEAEAQAAYSVQSLAQPWKPLAHSAHLIVISFGAGDTPLARTRNFHRVIAATAAAAGTAAVAVYIGSGGVTHEPRFYVETIKQMPDPMIVWSGVSVAKHGDRVSLLSRGMSQLGLPDVLLTAGPATSGDALANLFDLMLYVAQRGERLPSGDTIGGSQTQRIPVRYVASPIDPGAEVMQVEYP